MPARKPLANFPKRDSTWVLRNKRSRRGLLGLSLIELMITIAVLAILVSIAYPSYASFIRKGKRVGAQADLMDWANRQMNWRADHASYSGSINPADSENYAYTIVSAANSFTLTATALNDQVNDKEAGTVCSSLTLDQAGIVGPAGKEKCWRK